MRLTVLITLCALLAGCADGANTAARARADHDLSAFGNAKLALTSQVRTDADNVDDIARRAEAATR